MGMVCRRAKIVSSGIHIHLGLFVTTTKCCDYVSGVIIRELLPSQTGVTMFIVCNMCYHVRACVCVDVGGWINHRSAMVSSSRGFLGMNYVDVVL